MHTEEAMARACALPAADIEIFINAYSELSNAFIGRLRAMADAAGKRVVSLHPFTSGFEPMLFFRDYDRRFDDGIALYSRYFEACAALGGRYVVLHGDKLGTPTPDEVYFERYARLYDIAESFGVLLCQENVARCTSGQPAMLAKMKKALGDRVKFVLDVKQARRAGAYPCALCDILGESLAHVHLSDFDEASDCLPPGQGKMDYPRFLAHLKNAGFSGTLTLELYRDNYPDDDALRDALLFISSLIYE
jgi:sugar phosphate isomerase/epimerase